MHPAFLEAAAPGKSAMLFLMLSSCIAEQICSGSLLMCGLVLHTPPQGALPASPNLKRLHAAAGQALDSPVASHNPCPMAAKEPPGTSC